MIDSSVVAAALRETGARAWSRARLPRQQPRARAPARRPALPDAPCVPAPHRGEPPRLLLSAVEATGAVADRLPGVTVERYTRWTELERWPRDRVAPLGRAALE